MILGLNVVENGEIEVYKALLRLYKRLPIAFLQTLCLGSLSRWDGTAKRQISMVASWCPLQNPIAPVGLAVLIELHSGISITGRCSNHLQTVRQFAEPNSEPHEIVHYSR